MGVKRRNIEKRSIEFEKGKLYELVGEAYEPFLKNRDVPSLGKRTRIKSWTVGRTHHLFSNLELGVFMTLDTNPDVVDIREQYALLPLKTVRQLAADLDIPYSMNGAFHVYTTDFLVTLSDGTYVAYSVKPTSELSNRRVLEKLALENRFWTLNGVRHSIVTERDLNGEYLDSVSRYHEYRFDWVSHEERVIDLAVEDSLLSAIKHSPNTELRQLCSAVDRNLNIPSGFALRTVKRCLANEKWLLKRGCYFHPQKPLSLMAGCGV